MLGKYTPLVASGVTEERGIFYFTHSGTLLKLISFLNIFQAEIKSGVYTFHFVPNPPGGGGQKYDVLVGWVKNMFIY